MTRVTSSAVWLCAALSGVWGLPGCGRSTALEDTRSELVVFAASSLADAFGDVERSFEAAHPDIDVRLSVAGSQVLRLQLEQGARADVFASANEAHAAALTNEGVVGTAQVFARNELVVIVPRTTPPSARTFDGFSEARRVVLGRRDVPVGAYARQVLDRVRDKRGPDFASRIEGHVVSEEHNVRLVRAKVELGEADAALVYRSDASRRDALHVIEIPPSMNVHATYVAAVASASARPEHAQSFVDYLRSPPGQAILATHAFLGFTAEGT